jgi:hypothetical protein
LDDKLLIMEFKMEFPNSPAAQPAKEAIEKASGKVTRIYGNSLTDLYLEFRTADDATHKVSLGSKRYAWNKATAQVIDILASSRARPQPAMAVTL